MTIPLPALLDADLFHEISYPFDFDHRSFRVDPAHRCGLLFKDSSWNAGVRWHNEGWLLIDSCLDDQSGLRI